MEFLYLFLLFSSYAVVLAGDNVMELTDSDFDYKTADHETLLVMFYAPWCGHCKRLKPEYEKAAGLLKDNDPPVTLARIDCTEAGKDTCNKFAVNGYPTLKIFRNGDFSQEYNGPREANGIVKYMQSQVGPSSKEFHSEEEFNKLIDKPETVVIGFFEEDSPLKQAFLKTAEKMREKVTFAHTSNKDMISKAGLKNGIVLYRPKLMHNKFEPNSVEYTGEASKDDISSFIKKNYESLREFFNEKFSRSKKSEGKEDDEDYGMVGHRHRDNMDDFHNPLVVAYYAVDYIKNAKGTNYWRNRILKVAKDFIDDFTFAISAKDDFQHELNEFGLSYVSGDKPVIFARNEKNQKFQMKDEFNFESFNKFLQDLRGNRLEPFVKSEPIPDENEGPVKVAVAKNFDEIVTKSGRDALIEFYAPWCGHCKKLAPVYEELGEKMKDEDVDIIKMDATSNDVPPPYDVRGFPTLYWAPKNKKSDPIKYEGGRELQDFIKYIAKHSTDSLRGFDRNGKAKHEEL